jgi:hypothetical protein
LITRDQWAAAVAVVRTAAAALTEEAPTRARQADIRALTAAARVLSQLGEDQPDDDDHS